MSESNQSNRRSREHVHMIYMMRLYAAHVLITTKLPMDDDYMEVFFNERQKPCRGFY